MRELYSPQHILAHFLPTRMATFFLETFKKPFNFIKALRTKNPTILDLEEYFLNFLKYIKTLNKLI